MRKIAVLAAALLMSGCATSNPNAPLPNAQDLLAQVQAYTVQACHFLPTVSGVANLIAQFYPAGIPAVQAATVIGQAICDGTVGATAKRTGTVYKRVQTPRGVVSVPGKFVR